MTTRIKLFTASLFLLFITSLAMPGLTASGGNGWSSYMADSRHSGSSPFMLGDNAEGVSWKYELSGGSYFPPLVDQEGNIYLAQSTNVIKFDRGREVQWNVHLNTTIESSLALSDDDVLYACGRQTPSTPGFGVYAIDHDGAILWNCMVGMISISSPTIAEDGTLYVGTFAPSTDHGPVGNDSIVAIDPAGQIKWQHCLDEPVLSSPAITPDGHIIVASNERVLALNRSGDLDWESEIIPGITNSVSASIDAEGKIFIKTRGSLVCLFPNGTIDWVRTLDEDHIDVVPVCLSNGAIVSSDNMMYRFDDDGNLTWTYVADDRIQRNVIVSANEKVVFCTGSDILVLDGKGTLEDRITVPIGNDDDSIWGPVITPDGNIIVSSDALGIPGYLFVIGEEPADHSLLIGLVIVITVLVVIAVSWYRRRR